MKKLTVSTRFFDYDIFIMSKLIQNVASFLDVQKTYVIITDSGVPVSYLTTLQSQINVLYTKIIPQGEKSKSMNQYHEIIEELILHEIKKDTFILALGGGVVGDLAGFVASTYLRGVPFIQIPTTLLSQVDSSIGGKVAINSNTAKNMIGQFYPPQKVLIDPFLLLTLPPRQIANGFAEIIKIAAISDADFFEQLEKGFIVEELEEIIFRSLELKKRFVEADELDQGIRQALNFGHTFGHAIEQYYHYDRYLHGEAVAIGMVLIVSSEEVKDRLRKILAQYRLPTDCQTSIHELYPIVLRDKKSTRHQFLAIDVPQIGQFIIRPLGDLSKGVFQ
jgi:3-dehydroquinate synthase